MCIFAQMIKRLFTYQPLASIISAFIAVATVFGWWQTVSFELVDLAKALPGEATFNGIDIGKRVNAFYTGLLIFGFAFIAANAALKAIIFKKTESVLQKLLGLTFWVTTMLTVIVFAVPWLKLSVEVTAIIAMTLLSIIALLTDTSQWGRPPFRRIRFHLLMAANSWLFMHIFILSVFNTSPPVWLIALMVTFLGVLDFNTSRRNKQSNKGWQHRLYSLLPLIALLSHEGSLVLNQQGANFNTSPIIFGVLTSLAGLFIYQKHRRGAYANITLNQAMSQFYFPWFIASFFTIVAYEAAHTNILELFETANPANAVLRTQLFGEFPFIDFITSHMLYEQIPQYIYTWLNGFDGSLAFMTYGFYYIMPLSGLLYYFFFRKLFNSGGWAFAFVMFFPFMGILIPTTFIWHLITIFLSFRLIRNASVANGSKLLLWAFLLIFWRIDIAAATIPALFVFGLLHLAKQRFERNTLFAWGIPALATSILVFAFYGLVYARADGDTSAGGLRSIHSALAYFGGSQAHGETHIIGYKPDSRWLLHYLLFPMVVACIFIVSTRKWLVSGNKKQQFAITSVILLCLYYFFNAQRGLVRHGFIEGTDKYISSFVFIIVPLFLLTLGKWRKPVFVFISAAGLFILLAHFPTLEGHTANAIAAKKLFEEYTPLDYSKKIPRWKWGADVKDEKKQQVKTISAFLKNELADDETFLDFSNSPMLYFYAQKQVPAYFNQTLQALVSRDLQRNNQAYGKGVDIPLVVFSHFPDNWWDNTDGVPNSIRYQNICKEIYLNYQPWRIVEGYQVWKRNDLLDSAHRVPQELLYPRQFKLKYFPAYFHLPDDIGGPVQEYKADKPVQSLREKVIFRDLDAQIGQYLKFKLFGRGTEMSFEVNYYDSKSGEALGSYSFKTQEGKQDYMLPLWSQYNWHIMKPDVVVVEVIDGKPNTDNPLFREISIKEYPPEREH